MAASIQARYPPLPVPQKYPSHFQEHSSSLRRHLYKNSSSCSCIRSNWSECSGRKNFASSQPGTSCVTVTPVNLKSMQDSRKIGGNRRLTNFVSLKIYPSVERVSLPLNLCTKISGAKWNNAAGRGYLVHFWEVTWRWCKNVVAMWQNPLAHSVSPNHRVDLQFRRPHNIFWTQGTSSVQVGLHIRKSILFSCTLKASSSIVVRLCCTCRENWNRIYPATQYWRPE